MKKTQNKRTSEILQELQKGCAEHKKISVAEFTDKISDRAFGILILIFSILGLLPGASVLFSIPILIIAVQIILGQKQIWLPKWIGNKTFSEAHLSAALKKVIPTLKLIETLIRPRLSFLTTDLAERFVAIIILALAAVLFLPLPGFNMVPAAAMCLLALGILEKDGLLIFLGSIISIIGLYLMSYAIIKALAKISEYIGSFF